VRVWIDTDVGSDVDDALAIAYALRHPAIELVGVSTVFGDVDLRSRIAKRLLELGGQPDVPVVTGRGAPLTPRREGRMFGHEGVGILNDPSPRRVTKEDSEAEQRTAKLAAALAESRAEALVAIGPATNLGALARAGYALPPLTFMGGKVENVSLPGMIEAIPEWNWWCDPVAVQNALDGAHPAPPRVIPAEVTFGTRLPAEDIDRLANGDALARQLSVLCAHWIDAQRDRLGNPHPAVLLHDPLAVATLVAPDLAAFAERRIRVDATGHTHQEADGTAAAVATETNNDVLRAHLLEIWLGDENEPRGARKPHAR
jgi:purine nucleosidase